MKRHYRRYAPTCTVGKTNKGTNYDTLSNTPEYDTYLFRISQKSFTCSNSTIETLVEGWRYVQN